MDLEELRCRSQVNGNYSENRYLESNYFNNEHEFTGYEEPDLALLTSCEFCNRTFLPASLNKHKRGCYKSWLKMKERESKMSNEHEKSFITNGCQGEKPILTIEQMLAKRRQRRLNWRLRHEEFMRAVHAARDYAEAVASGNPLPPPPPPVVEPDLRQCPHCQRKFHEKSVDRHIVRCKEQSIRNSKERPSYQTMEAKRRLAVRLYYQPNSRPNSCLSMSNTDIPTSFSRPSSRQTDFDYGRNIESSNSFNISRHSSLSVIDRNEIKKKIPSSLIENLNRAHDRVTPRHSFKDIRSSQNNTPTFDYRVSTPTIPDQYYGGRRSTMSMGLSRASSRQSMNGTISEFDYSSKRRNESQISKQDSCTTRRNIRRSTSCISQIRPISNSKTSNPPTDNSAKSEIKICNHKPFSCNRSDIKEQRMSKELSKSNSQINKISDIEKTFSRNRVQEVKEKSIKRDSDRTSINGKTSRPSSAIEKSEMQIHRSTSRTLRVKNEQKIETNSEVSTKISHHKSKIVCNTRKENEKKENITESNRSDYNKVDVNEIPKNPPDKMRTQNPSKQSNSDVNLNNQKTENVKSNSTENLKLIAKTQSSIPVSGNRVRNEIQIRIKSHTKPESIKRNNEDDNETLKKVTVFNSQQSVKDNIPVKISAQEIPEKDKPYSSFRQIDSKGEAPSPPQSSLRFVSNCSLSKTREQAQGDSTFISSKIINNDENKQQIIQPLNLYQCKSVKSVSISDQNNITKFKSTISLQDSLNQNEENQKRNSKSIELNHFCHECGHKFPGHDAKFCCSCGSKRSEMMLQK